MVYGRDGKRRSDSLISLDPPQIVSPEGGDPHLEHLEEEQQTRLQQGRQFTRPQSVHDAPRWQHAWQPPTDAMSRQHREGFSPSELLHVTYGGDYEKACSDCCKQPLKEHPLNVVHRNNTCRHRLENSNLSETSFSSLDSLHSHREPQRHDENGDFGAGNILQLQLLQQKQQKLNALQNQVSRHHLQHYDNHQLHGYDNKTPRCHFNQQRQKGQIQQQYLANAHTNQTQHQPQLFAAMLGQNASSPLQYLSSVPQPDLSVYLQNAHVSTLSHPSPLVSLGPGDFVNTTAQVASKTDQTFPQSGNTDTQQLKMLRPEIIRYNEQFSEHQSTSRPLRFNRALSTMGMGSTGSATSESSGSISSWHDASLNSRAHGPTANVVRMVLSEDDESSPYSDSTSHDSASKSSSYSSSSSSSSSDQTHKLCPVNKVLRSKSLNYHPERCREHSDQNSEGELKKTQADSNRSSKTNQLSPNFVPVGPPALPSDSLEVQHSSLSSLSSLRSGMTSYGSATSIPEEERCPAPQRLTRSASSSPAVGLESAAVTPRILYRNSGNFMTGQEVWPIQTYYQPVSYVMGIPDQPDCQRFRRCSIDEDVLKYNADEPDRGSGTCRRFSVAGISSVSSPSNIVSSSRGGTASDGSSNGLVNSLSSVSSSGDVRNLSRNLSSAESAYGSSETSLVSSVGDSCGYVHGRTSISDSATDLSCDREELGAVRSRRQLTGPLLSPLAASEASPETKPKNKLINTRSCSPLLRPPTVTRFNSLPNYNIAEPEDNNSNNINSCANRQQFKNINDLNNRFPQLNDLSLCTSRQHPKGLSLPSKSTLFDTHQSMPPLTCINIPIN